MRVRMLTLAGCAAALVTAHAPIAAQSAAPAKAAMPRSADGHPDLQGTYDVATMTPVERPAGITSPVLTNEQAAAMEQYEAQRQGKNDRPPPARRPRAAAGRGRQHHAEELSRIPGTRRRRRRRRLQQLLARRRDPR